MANHRPLLIAWPMLLAMFGCHANDAELTRQALRSQAAQNQTMAQLQREVAAGARELTAADADARRQSVELQQQIQTERAQLSEGWSDLHLQRQRDARSRRTESFLSDLIRGGGATAAALFALAIARSALSSNADDDRAELAALLLEELSGSSARDDAASHEHHISPLVARRLAVQHPEEL